MTSLVTSNIDTTDSKSAISNKIKQFLAEIESKHYDENDGESTENNEESENEEEEEESHTEDLLSSN